MGRSVGAIVAGYVLWTAIWLAAGAGVRAAWGAAFEEHGGTSHPGVLLVVLSVSVAASLVSGWLAAAIAARTPRRHALILGLALLITGIGVEASAWDLLPLWFHAAFLALLVPMTLAGAACRSSGSRKLTTAAGA